jgi:hypothetical protein
MDTRLDEVKKRTVKVQQDCYSLEELGDSQLDLRQLIQGSA